VRSGIGFTRHQKEIVHSLGLNKLNHTVVRPDTPQIRGIVAAAPHMLQIVPEPPAPAWAGIPEYTVHAPAAAPAEAVSEPVVKEANAPEAGAAGTEPKIETASEGSAPAQAGKE